MSKRDHILAVAESLFNQFGYTAVGVDKIRDEAAVSKTSMYRHFGAKSALIEAVLQARHTRFEQGLQQAIDAHQDKDAQLAALLDWHLAWFKQDDFKGCMFMHAIGEFKSNTDSQIVEIAKAHKDKIYGLIEQIVGSKAVADAVMTLLEGLIVRAEFDALPDRELCLTMLRSLIRP
ncbi:MULTISPECIES: TetR/AcrR family transcriptional regulator [unclassified Salinivibrio]|uniref:TetR/AcrR family transcriptional regulator n=1 Tax=unclassified Salinivibrio TaxID=2636825 RepID=UPI0009840F6D|nr:MULTISPECIES: TetR/AcrR family transcriptional regulator [unclassified Salinivibrio]OOF10709.1 TetR family transcriptional regulator [Salinivibrio sp. PR919]OOF14887.1 TetR family transcriptional regulator [Salinivibrio sp. PR932]